jgi:hypothetical protein
MPRNSSIVELQILGAAPFQELFTAGRTSLLGPAKSDPALMRLCERLRGAISSHSNPRGHLPPTCWAFPTRFAALDTFGTRHAPLLVIEEAY